jgi:hypothetical protein
MNFDFNLSNIPGQIAQNIKIKEKVFKQEANFKAYNFSFYVLI